MNAKSRPGGNPVGSEIPPAMAAHQSIQSTETTMMNTDTTAARAAKAPAFTSDVSIDEMSEAVRMLLGMRQIANQTSLLANHWQQEGLEDLADDLCRGLDDRLDELEAELRARPSSADIDDVLTLISITLYPGRAGREDHPRRVTA